MSAKSAPMLVDSTGRPLVSDRRRAALMSGYGYGGGAWTAASTTQPHMRDWTPSAGSPDGENDGDRAAIVARARDLVRNAPLVSGAERSLKDSAIGLGLDFQSMPAARTLGLSPEEARDYGCRIEDLWREWAENPQACDVTGVSDFGMMTRYQTGCALIAGEAFALPLWLPGRQAKRGSRFATTLKTFEPDRVSNPMDTPSDIAMRDGIEIDEWGAPVAMHIRKRHPGDQWLMGAYADTMTWERVPMQGPMGRPGVIHLFDRCRPDQQRGVSWLAPVMATLKQDDRYKTAELQAAVSTAAIMAVLETPLDGQTLSDLFQGEALATERAGSHVQLGLGPGGLVPRLLPGEKLSGFAPVRPSSGFESFTTTVARHVAVGLGMTYETFIRDFSKTNYSSARASLLEGWRFILNLRMLSALRWCRPVLAMVVQEAVWRGYIDLPGFEDDPARRRAWLRGVWRGPARGWVDPVKEITAAAARIRLGISTLRDEAFEQGRDMDDLLDQIAVEQQALRDRGLTLPDVNFTTASPQDRNASENAD